MPPLHILTVLLLLPSAVMARRPVPLRPTGGLLHDSGAPLLMQSLAPLQQQQPHHRSNRQQPGRMLRAAAASAGAVLLSSVVLPVQAATVLPDLPSIHLTSCLLHDNGARGAVLGSGMLQACALWYYFGNVVELPRTKPRLDTVESQAFDLRISQFMTRLRAQQLEELELPPLANHTIS